MKFGPLPLAEAEGALLGHSRSVGRRRLKKGHRLTADDIAALRTAGVETVIAARIEADDLLEDQAAERIARAAQGRGTRLQAAFTGRSNLYAEAAGVALLDAARVDRLNLVDESGTIATVAPFETVEPGQMLATVKVIPFAAPRASVEACTAIAAEGAPLVSVAAFQPHRAGLVLTRLPDTKPGILEKTIQTVRERLAALGSELAATDVVAHDEQAIAAAVRRLLEQHCDPILIFGASAIVDRRDVVPAGLVAAGGEILHFGMPVDPGNLLLLGRHGQTRVIGVPGCARSPKLNGFDWVLRRQLAGLEVGRADIMRMGAGGLLKEIASRPQPREHGDGVAPRASRVAALVLAAGQSRRMGRNKLLEPLSDVPMIVRTVDAVLASQARPVIVVTGHQADEIRTLLKDRPVALIHNADFEQGLSSSLKRGLSAVPPECDGVLVCLGDMPRVRPQHLDRLIAAFNPTEGRAICVPTWSGKRGNPVLFAASFIPAMRQVAGDTGARHLIGEHAEVVREVAMEDDGVLIDVDTPESLAALRAGAR